MPIGESLRRARTERGLELGAISEAIKIRVRYLRALEAEDWAALPAPAYARGFLRTYAGYLGLDADAMVEELRRTLEASPDTAPAVEELRPPVAEPPSAFPSPRTLIVAGVAVAVLALLYVIGQVGGGGGSGGGGQGGGPTVNHHARHHKHPHAPAPPPQPTQASIEVRPTGTVWVCLESLAGKRLVPGEILSTGENRGPYRAAGFQLGLGNGEAAITANGKPLKVPSSPNPLAYHVGPKSAKAIDPAKRPTCA